MVWAPISNTPRNRRHNRHRVAFPERGVFAAGDVVNVLVVDIDADEVAELTVVGEQVLLDLRVLLRQPCEHLADGLGRHGHVRLIVRQPTQCCRYGYCHRHTCSEIRCYSTTRSSTSSNPDRSSRNVHARTWSAFPFTTDTMTYTYSGHVARARSVADGSAGTSGCEW